MILILTGALGDERTSTINTSPILQMRKQTWRTRIDVQKATAVKQEPGVLEPSESIWNTLTPSHPLQPSLKGTSLIGDLNIKAVSIKLLGEDMGASRHNPRFGYGFLDMESKSQVTKNT